MREEICLFLRLEGWPLPQIPCARYGEDGLDPCKSSYLMKFGFMGANYKLLRAKYGELTDESVAGFEVCQSIGVRIGAGGWSIHSRSASLPPLDAGIPQRRPPHRPAAPHVRPVSGSPPHLAPGLLQRADCLLRKIRGRLSNLQSVGVSWIPINVS